MKRPPGRPPSDNPKSPGLQVRLTAEQRAYLDAEVERSEHKTVAEYVRAKILPKRLR